MFIQDPPKSQTRKELKVNLPVRQHQHLRAIRARTGSETPRIVADALGMYFAKLAREMATRTRE